MSVFTIFVYVIYTGYENCFNGQSKWEKTKTNCAELHYCDKRFDREVAVFWDVAPSILAEIYRSFRNAYCLQQEGFMAQHSGR